MNGAFFELHEVQKFYSIVKRGLNPLNNPPLLYFLSPQRWFFDSLKAPF